MERKTGSRVSKSAMSRSFCRLQAKTSAGALPADADRLARAQKNARLKILRTHASWLVFDPQAHFHDEIDCSAVFGESSMRDRSDSS